MDTHKKLVMGALVLTVVATTASMAAYMSTVSQKSKAASREDIQKLVNSLYPSVTPTKSIVVPKFSVDKRTIKSAGVADLKTQSASVDKSKLHVEVTNTTGKDMKEAKVFFKVSGKSGFSLGSPTGATVIKNGPTLKKGYVGYTLPNLKPGQKAIVDVPFAVKTQGSQMSVRALLQIPGSAITTTQPVTIRAN